MIDNFKIAASKTDKRETTIQAEANNGSAFLLCLQDQGAKTLNDVTTTMIQKFFFDGERQIRGHTYKNNIVAVLKGNREFDTWAECKRIINSVPPIRRSRKIIHIYIKTNWILLNQNCRQERFFLFATKLL